jgi:hypothetical protein
VSKSFSKSRIFKLIIAATALTLIISIILIVYTINKTRNITPDDSQAASDTPPTLEDYWQGKATFQYENDFSFPGGAPNAQGKSMSGGITLIVKDGTWYIFHREYISNRSGDPTARCEVGKARIVVQSSTNKGKTWSNKVIVVEPTTPTAADPNPVDECLLIDGDAYYDGETNTWHYIYQCLPHIVSWNLCHATHVGSSPMAKFDKGQGDYSLSVKSTSLIKRILGSKTTYAEEGTPDIIEKRGEYFYVSFHAMSWPTYSLRALAKTKDFKTWETVNNDAIFDKDNCKNWNSQWDTNGCVGGGLSRTVKQGAYYYTAIEAMDKTLLCKPGQEWDFGLIRSKVLESTNWENMPSNSAGKSMSPFFYSTHELDQNNNQYPLCGTQYVDFFTQNGETYFIGMRIGQLAGNVSRDADTLTSIYVYKLKKTGPVASYKFREGPFTYNNRNLSHKFSQSDVLIPGRMEAKLNNITWDKKTADGTYALRFNGTDSSLELPKNDRLDMKSAVSLHLDLNINKLPTANSIFLVGKPGSYYFDLFKDGNLCFWAIGKGVNNAKNTCFNVTSELGKNISIDGVFANSQITIFKNSIYQNSTKPGYTELAKSGSVVKVGSFDGLLDTFNIYDYALNLNYTPPQPTKTPTPRATVKPAQTSTPTQNPTRNPTPTPTKITVTNPPKTPTPSQVNPNTASTPTPIPSLTSTPTEPTPEPPTSTPDTSDVSPTPQDANPTIDLTINEGTIFTTRRPTLTGHTAPNTSVEISVSSLSEKFTIESDDAGNWSFTPDQNLPDGIYSYYAKILDAENEVIGSSNVIRFTVKTTQTTTNSSLVTILTYTAAILTLILIIIGGLYFYKKKKN